MSGRPAWNPRYMIKQFFGFLFAWWIASPVLIAQIPNEVFSRGYEGPYIAFVGAGEVTTLFVAPLNVADAVASQTPLPTSLSGVSVSVRVTGAVDATGYPPSLPILRVQSVTDGAVMKSYTAVTVQIPTERVCASPPTQCRPATDFPPQLVLNVRANGVSGPDYTVHVASGTAHLLNSCDSVVGGLGPVQILVPCSPAITHADGTLVSFANPAKVGETIVAYASGLGPYGTTGSPTQMRIPNSYGQITFRYRLETPSQLVAPAAFLPVDHYINPDYVGLVSSYVGLYQINFTVPPMPGGTYQCQMSTVNPPSEIPSDVNATIEMTATTFSLNIPGGSANVTGRPVYLCVAP
jgi:uncharacterized protein (TIGR03437 family)